MDAAHYYVPQYDGLNLEALKAFVYGDEQLAKYFPEPRDFWMLEKKFVCDLCYSVKRQEFADWVQARLDARNVKKATVQDSQVVMSEKVAKAFMESKMVSRK